LEIELKNIILRRVSIFEFLHSQGQNRKWRRFQVMSALPLKADIAGLKAQAETLPSQSFSTEGRAHGFPSL
jgi:hypothetical protein